MLEADAVLDHRLNGGVELSILLVQVHGLVPQQSTFARPQHLMWTRKASAYRELSLIGMGLKTATHRRQWVLLEWDRCKSGMAVKGIWSFCKYDAVMIGTEMFASHEGTMITHHVPYRSPEHLPIFALCRHAIHTLSTPSRILLT